MDSQDSPQFGLGGSHHLPPYNILCAWPQGLHSNAILSWDYQIESLEILEIKTLATLEAHNFLCRPLIELRFKKTLYPLLQDFQQYVARYL
jgi:hypothetical protein